MARISVLEDSSLDLDVLVQKELAARSDAAAAIDDMHLSFTAYHIPLTNGQVVTVDVQDELSTRNLYETAQLIYDTKTKEQQAAFPLVTTFDPKDLYRGF